MNHYKIDPEYQIIRAGIKLGGGAAGSNDALFRLNTPFFVDKRATSLLEKAFELGEKFITASKEHYDPGIIGPFCLQTCIDKDMNYSIYDVAPRLGGGTNVHVSVGHPYGNATWRKPVSSGRRIAMEIRRAAEQDRLLEVLT